MTICVFGLSTFFGINKVRLPINFHLFFLPIDCPYSFNWLINFLFQLYSILCASLVYSPYITTVLILFNHTRWHMDSLIILLAKLDRNENAGTSKIDHKLIKTRLEVIYKSHLDALDWMKQVQKTIQFNYLVESSIFSLLICLCIYTISDNPLSLGYVNLLVVALLIQLFINSLIGTSVMIKIEELRKAIYNVEWYNYNAENMKTIRIMLQSSQNMQQYHGIFKKISMETFQQVN
jgi:hypothetical protein